MIEINYNLILKEATIKIKSQVLSKNILEVEVQKLLQFRQIKSSEK